MYKLRYSNKVADAWNALPAKASEELTLALADVCRDPYAATEPHGTNGDVQRILTLRHTRTVILLIEPGMRIRILSIRQL